MRTIPVEQQIVDAHFSARAERYNLSSRWCSDNGLLQSSAKLVIPKATDDMLDVAVGTGYVSRFYRGLVSRIVGIDINMEMAKQAGDAVDELHIGRAEALPFPDGSFDIVACRQGIQFMDVTRALKEMVRVLKPGGRIVLVDLCAYGEVDSTEYFEVLRLRNPARRNFFVYGDIAALLTRAGCDRVETRRHISIEDVDAWADNGAIDEGRREAIRAVYRNASEAFLEHHGVERDGSRVMDRMLFAISVGRIDGAANLQAQEARL
jgi:SAM-dependent methyltransferase